MPPFHRGTTFRYRLVVGMASYFLQMKNADSKFNIYSCDKPVVKNYVYTALGPVLLCGTLAGTSLGTVNAGRLARKNEALPMEVFARMQLNSNADKCMMYG